MSNILPGEGLRDVYVKDSGNDVNGGGNIVQSVKTLSKAVEIVGMINPPAGIFNPASIIDVGSSSYAEQLLIPDDVQVTIPACRITMDGSFDSGVLAGERSLLRIGQILTGVQGGQVGYSTNGSTRVGLTCTAIICNGDNDIAYSVDGGSSDVFCETSQIITRGNNSTAISYTATGSQPRVMELNEINLEGSGSKGVLYNAGSPEVCTLKVAAITDLGGAGNVALQASRGKIACFVNEIQAETAIKVDAGAELDLFDARVDGDIVVDAGGTLNIFVLEHNGTITNNGVINGQIGSEEFGSEIKTSDDIVNNSGVSGSTLTDALNNISLLYGHIGVTSDAPFTTTSDAAQLVDTWSLTLPDTDTYDVTVTVEWSLNAANQDAIFRFDVNSAVGLEINQEPKDTTNKIFFTTFALVGLQSGANTIEFFARKESGNSSTLTVFSNRFMAQKINVLS